VHNYGRKTMKAYRSTEPERSVQYVSQHVAAGGGILFPINKLFYNSETRKTSVATSSFTSIDPSLEGDARIEVARARNIMQLLLIAAERGSSLFIRTGSRIQKRLNSRKKLPSICAQNRKPFNP
jgi:hypothetical protein